MAAEALCGSVVSSRRGLLAFLWSIVTGLTAIAFLVALAFALTAKNIDEDDYYNNNNENNDEDDPEEQEQNNAFNPETAVTSRAMAFAALWTAVLASLLSLFGMVILGFQSPTGQYYTCCSGNVHRTTQLGLGSFIGALIMFANLTLVCSVLFGEFQIRDYHREGGEGDGQQEGESAQERAVERSSMAFSIMCMFLTVLYAGFAILTYAYSNKIMEENLADERTQELNANLSIQTGHRRPSFYIGERVGQRLDVRPGAIPTPTATSGSYVAPPASESTMA